MSHVSNLFRMIVDVLRARLEIFFLQRKINSLKLLHYDLLEESNRALQLALDTKGLEIRDMRSQLVHRDMRIEQLKTEYATLREQQSKAENRGVETERLTWFKKLQAVATQLPTVKAALEAGAPLSAHDMLGLISPMEEALHDQGFEPIGQAGGFTIFDPTRHHAVGRGARNLSASDVVRIRYVGYLFQGKVMSKAEVTRAESEDVVHALN